MFSFCISCQEVHILVQAHGALASSVALRLQKDFSNFKSGQPDLAEVILELHDQDPSDKDQLSLVFQTNKARAYGWGHKRVAYYSQNTVVRSKDNKVRILQIGSSNYDKFYEVAYLSLLSSWGEVLEQRQFIRIHSLAFAVRKYGFTLHFSSGLGKSTLAALLSRESHFKILSDEITLFKDNKLFSFPLRMAFSKESASFLNLPWSEEQTFQREGFEPKLLHHLNPDQLIESSPFHVLLYGVKSPSQDARIVKSFSLKMALRFLFDLSIGKHLPQILELALRKKTLFFLPVMIFRRFRLGLELLIKGKVHVFYVSQNASANKRALAEFVDSELRDLK